MTKKRNKIKILPTYLPILFFWSMWSPVLHCTQTYCHTAESVLVTNMWNKWSWLMRVHFSPKKGEVGKIEEEWKLLRENNLRLLTIPGIYIKVTSFIIYPSFQTLLVYFRNRHLYQNLACRAHFQFNNHDLFENVD